MPQLYTICYLGTDDVFYDDLIKYYNYMASVKQNMAFDYSRFDVTIEYGIETFLAKCDDTPPDLTFIDFYNMVEDNTRICDISHMMLTLKKSYYFNTIAFVGLFATKDDLFKHSYMFSYGMCYSYIKRDTSEGTVFRDPAYIGLGIGLRFETFAVAPDIDLFYKLGAIASVPGFAINAIDIETDLSIEPSFDMIVKFFFFPDFNIEKFPISIKNHGERTYDHVHRYVLEIPYHNKLKAITDDVVPFYNDTMDTWIENSSLTFDDKLETILIIDGDELPPLEIYKLKRSCKYNIERRTYVAHYNDSIYNLRPSIIFFNMDDDEENKKGKEIPSNNTNMLFQIINAIKLINDYVPIIILFNSPSTSTALQKAYGYTALLAHKEHISIEPIAMLLAISSKKQSVNSKGKIYYPFKLCDIRRKALVKEEILITSLTEHEITFASKKEYPCFTTFQIDVPVDAFITIVEPTHELKFVKNNFHYMAFIHGVDEQDLSYLRKFVNKIIFEPLEEFVRIGVEEDEEEALEKEFELQEELLFTPDNIIKKEEELVPEKEKKVRIRKAKNRTSSFKGKSKL